MAWEAMSFPGTTLTVSELTTSTKTRCGKILAKQERVQVEILARQERVRVDETISELTTDTNTTRQGAEGS